MTVKSLKLNLPQSAEDLLDTILDHYPIKDQISLKKVIGLGQIRYAEKLPGGQRVTAAVINTKPYSLIFGKSFIEENLEDMDDLVYLLSHELTHLVLDHFAPDILKEFKDVKRSRVVEQSNGSEKTEEYEGLSFSAMHIIVDCQVNATVYNSLKEEKYLKFIKKYYPKNEMPCCFFRPDGEPDGENLSDELKTNLINLHKKLYSESGITNRELIEGLMPWFEQEQNNYEKLKQIVEKLLGNHEDILNNKGANASSEELENLTEIVAKNYLNNKGDEESTEQKGKKVKAGKGQDLREVMVEITLERIEAAQTIRKNLKSPNVVSPSARIYRAIESYSPKHSVRSVVPNFHDRRTTAVYSTGRLPVFHKNTTLGSKVKVACYLDVSGSQDHVIPVMIPVVSRLKKLIGDVVYCFSTEVNETKISELKSGKYKTTGGTDFTVVLEHILKNKFKQAVILTDGHAYATDEVLQKVKQKKVDITVGWTENKPSLNPLDAVAGKTFYVFGEE